MTSRTTERAYFEYKKVADKLLAAAGALSPSKDTPDGPGVLALLGVSASSAPLPMIWRWSRPITQPYKGIPAK